MKVLIDNLLRSPHSPHSPTNTCQLQINLDDVVLARSPEEVKGWGRPDGKRSRFEIMVELRGRPHYTLAFATSEAAWVAWRKICPEAAANNKVTIRYRGIRGARGSLPGLQKTIEWLTSRGYDISTINDHGIPYNTYAVSIQGEPCGETFAKTAHKVRVLETHQRYRGSPQ